MNDDTVQTDAKVNRHLVIINQATNYLTIGFANAFKARFDNVSLVTGSVHAQGEDLDPAVDVHWINLWHERPAWKKATSYLLALANMWRLLLTRFRHCDVLFVSVPPMGYLLNLVTPNRFSMVIWDVYPDVFKIVGMRETSLVYRIWSYLNKLSFGKAWCVMTIGDVMAESLGQYMDHKRLVVQPIWSIFQRNERIARSGNPFIAKHGLQGKFIVQYSGNIGLTHNLEVLIDVAECLRDCDHVLFQIIGRGPSQPAIERLIKKRALDNVQMLPFQTDEMFPYSLSAASLGVVVLHESVGKGSVPSKAYNLMSFGVPGLYIASPDSELANYARSFGHAGCFRAANIDAIAQFIKELSADKHKMRELQSNAESAAAHFRRSNADLFVQGYLEKGGREN